MESPHLYDTEYTKKGAVPKLKSNQLFQHDIPEYEPICGLTNSDEISVDLQNLLDENHHNPPFAVNEHLIQGLAGLNVDKNSLPGGAVGNHCPRGLGADPGMGGVQNSLGNTSGGMYNPLAYIPNAVHGGSQFDRPYQHERLPIKEEPQESGGDPHHEYPPCARVSYGAWGGGLSPYPQTPTTVTGVDALLKNSPLKSPPGGMKIGQKTVKSDKSTDEYRRRRERNNIAVRKSREKAKLRSRETEERVKQLTDENKKLQEKCKYYLDRITMFHSILSSIDLPEPFKSEVRNTVEGLNIHQSHQQYQQILSL